MGNFGIVIALIIVIAIVIFLGAGGIDFIRSIIPKDLFKKKDSSSSGGIDFPSEASDNFKDDSEKSRTENRGDVIENSLIVTSRSSKAIQEAFEKDNDFFIKQITIPDARSLVSETSADRKKRELEIPQDVKFSTSLAGSLPTTGTQFKRGTETFKKISERERKRAEAISLALFGNTKNPNFFSTKGLTNEQIRQKAIEQSLKTDSRNFTLAERNEIALNQQKAQQSSTARNTRAQEIDKLGLTQEQTRSILRSKGLNVTGTITSTTIASLEKSLGRRLV